jgi:hypothetical protein
LPYSLASYERAINGISFGDVCKQHRGFKTGLFDECTCRPTARPSEKKRDFISAIMAKQGGLQYASIRKDNLNPQAQSFEHVFIGHARIWFFADVYAIAPLMDHACSHLAHELVHWTISLATFLHEFGGLVRYVYDQAARGCQLRLLVAQFAACVFEDVSGLEGWPMLLNGVPDFAAELVDQMTNRLG